MIQGKPVTAAPTRQANAGSTDRGSGEAGLDATIDYVATPLVVDRPTVDSEATSVGSGQSGDLFLDALPVAGVISAGQGGPIKTRSKEPPMLEDRFEVGKPVGRGGMGTVFVCWPKDAFADSSPKLVVKVCNSFEKRWTDRFEREFRIAAALSYPGSNFAQVVQMYRNRAGYLCYVMYLVEGPKFSETIGAYLACARDSRCDNPRVLKLIENELSITRTPDGFTAQHLNQMFRWNLGRLIELVGAAQSAHDRSIINRDIKPDNALVQRGKLIQIDLGLAKFKADNDLPQELPFAGNLNGDIEQTKLGSVLGTPVFMAPEQASGDAVEHSEKTDGYALGVILYQLLCGNDPVPFQSTRAGNHAEFLKKIAAGQIEPLEPFGFIQGERHAIKAICLKALATSPGDRYAKVGDMARDLEAWLAGDSVAAYSESGGPIRRVLYRAYHWVRQHTGTSVAAAITAVGLSGTGAYQYNHRSNAFREVEKATGEIAKTRERFLTTILRTASSNDREGGKDTFVVADLTSKSTQVTPQALFAAGPLVSNERVGDAPNISFSTVRIDQLPLEMLDDPTVIANLQGALETAANGLEREVESLYKLGSFDQVESAIKEAQQAQSMLQDARKQLEERLSNRRASLDTYKQFSTAMAPVHQFLSTGTNTNGFSNPQDRIDDALKHYIPEFREALSKPGTTNDDALLFPSVSVERLLESLDHQELTNLEESQIKSELAAGLRYKLINLASIRFSTYASFIPSEVIESAAGYINVSESLDPAQANSTEHLVLRYRLALTDGDRLRAQELRSQIEDRIQGAVAVAGQEFTMTGAELCLVGSLAHSENKHEQGLSLFQRVAGVKQQVSVQGDNRFLSARFAGKVGEIKCHLTLADIATRKRRFAEAEAYLAKAEKSCERAFGALDLFSEGTDRNALEAYLNLLGIGAIQALSYRIGLLQGQDVQVRLDLMRDAHMRALEAYPEGKKHIALEYIAMNYEHAGMYDDALQVTTSVLNLKNLPLQVRASSVAFRSRLCVRLGNLEQLLEDASWVLTESKADRSHKHEIFPVGVPLEVAISIQLFSTIASRKEELPTKLVEDLDQLTKSLLEAVMSHASRIGVVALPVGSITTGVAFDRFRRTYPDFSKQFADAMMLSSIVHD